MAKQDTIEMVELSRVKADPYQPRKNFDPMRLAELQASIRKYGIMNPLVVEETADGKTFILIDGERRYRAATAMNLDKVPVIVKAAQGDTQRLIQQFHLQEQHEGWSPVEKAVAVGELAHQMQTSIEGLSETLSLPARTIGDYIAFSKILEKSGYLKGEIPLSYARRIVQLRAFVKKQWLDHDKEFTEDDERELELSVIARIKSGGIRKINDITKIRDAVKSDYTSIKKFISNDKISTDKMFIDSNAKAAMHARNLVYSAASIQTHATKLVALGGIELVREDQTAVNTIKNAYEAIKRLQAQL